MLSSQEKAAAFDERWTPLHGFSGCKVYLVERNDNRFVRKIAKDQKYNDRLIQQKNKQHAFRYDNAAFSTATVINEGYTPLGLYYFDMDYLSGETAAHALGALPLSHIQTWSRSFHTFCATHQGEFLSPNIFLNKIAALKIELASLTSHELISAAFTRLDTAIWHGIPGSPCHGDLTLENIVVQDNCLHLLDFLDSFAESWFIDAAKLMQDFYGHWSFRHKPLSPNATLRLVALRERTEAGWAERHQNCLPTIRNLYILNLLRILPYCSEEKEKGYVEGMLHDAMKRR